MANMKFANNANTTLASSLTAIATSMSVTSATKFPVLTGAEYFYCTLTDVATQTVIEIVKVTATSGTTWTIARGQDGTTGTIFAAGDVVSLRLVRASLDDFPKLDEANTFTGTNTFSTPLTATNMTQSSGSTSGYLSSTDWTTFNSKAPGVTFTTNYIPYGQGTTTLNQSAGLQFDGTNMGIGRIPTTILDVYNSAGNSVIAQFSSAATNRSFIISQFAVSGSNSAGTDLNASGVGNVNGTLTLSTNSAERMRLHRTGGVSIGNTTDPGATNLSVTGTITSASYLVYTRGNILATVSQTAGVPTGGIIERGSNANGTYIKFADGTMICSKSSSGSGYGTTGSKTEAWTYPVAFTSLGSVSFYVVEPNATAGRWNVLYATTSVTGSNITTVVNVTTAFSQAPQIRYFALGTWF